MPTEDLGYYYRYRDETIYNGREEDLYFSPPNMKIVLDKYPIIKKTPKGAYILTTEYPNPQRLVLDHWRSKYAHPTELEAQANFLLRKQRQINIVQNQLLNAREAYFKGCELFGTIPEIQRAVSAHQVYGMNAIKNRTPEEEDEP